MSIRPTGLLAGLLCTTAAFGFNPGDMNAIASLNLEIQGPNMNAVANRISVGATPITATSDEPEMPDLTFSVILDRPGRPRLSDAIKRTIIYDWQFMIEYITGPLTPSGATTTTRRGFWTKPTTGTMREDGIWISARNKPAVNPMTLATRPAYVDENGSMRNWFVHTNRALAPNGYLAEDPMNPDDDLHVEGNNEFHLRNDCAGLPDNNCHDWGDELGGGFIYAAVRVRIPNPPNPPDPISYAVDEWVVWGVGNQPPPAVSNCPYNVCPQPTGAALTTDYLRRKSLLAVEAGTTSVALADRDASIAWLYIDYVVNNYGTIPLIPNATAPLSQAASNLLVKKTIKGITERETNVRHSAGNTYNAANLGAWMVPGGYPTIALDGGFGIGQLTFLPGRAGSTPTYKEIWSYRENLDKASEFYITVNLDRAISHLTANGHTPDSHEVLRDSLSNYNGGQNSHYYSYLEPTDWEDDMGNPAWADLRGGDFDTFGTPAMPRYAVRPPNTDYYRDLVFCDHEQGARYTNPDSQRTKSWNCTDGTKGAYQSYDVTSGPMSLTFDDLPRCISSSTCYSDRRATSLHYPELAATDPNVTVPSLRDNSTP